MTETGIVTKIEGDTVYVEGEASGGCAACRLNSHCMMASDQKKCTVAVKNDGFDVSVGDKVEYRFRESYFIGISASLYLLPAVMTVLFASSGYYLGNMYLGNADIGAIAGFAAGIIVSVAVMAVSGRKYRNFPRISRLFK